MALRTKTVEYAFPTDITTLAAATRRDLAAITLYIPETTSRTFRSVLVEVNVSDGQATAASLTSWLIGIKLGAAAFNDVTTTLTLTNTGDHQSHVFTRDVTSYFTSNFGAGASQTCQVGLQFAALATRNHTVKLYITYEYDDAATTQVKTVRIPLESITGGTLTNTLASIGTNQIPDLSSFLPEASKTFRHVWFECQAKSAASGTVALTLELALDAEAGVDAYTWQGDLNTSVYGKAIWVRNDMTTNATHDFKARCDNTTARITGLAVVLHVTYEYNESTSTSIMNSLVLPMTRDFAIPGNTAAADESRFSRALWIEEPTTIALAQSGVVFWCYDLATVNLSVQAGAQASSRTYALTLGSVDSGPFTCCHRIDSGSGAGSAITLARGLNTLTLDYWTGAAQQGHGVSALLYLNYTSGKHGSGSGVHNHSTLWSILENANELDAQRNATTATATFNLPESSWFVNGLGFELVGNAAGTTGTACFLSAEYGSGEGPAAGWAPQVGFLVRQGGELGVVRAAAYADENVWERWAGDTGRMALETARSYRAHAATNVNFAAWAWLTYHAITYSASGTVSGSSGGTVNIDLHRTSDGAKVGSTSRTGNGSYSITWYDNTANVYTVARESSTLLGRSDNEVAA